MKNILLVPGFVVDTYSQIEASFIELSSYRDDNIRFIWLVPHMDSRYNRYANVSGGECLSEPLYVKFLREKGVEFYKGNISKYNMFSNFILFYRVFKKYNIDIVYSHFGFERYYSALYAFIFGKKAVLNEHWHSLGTRFTALKKLFYKLFIDYYISVSDFITSTLPKGSNIITVKNGLQLSEPKDIKYEEKLKMKTTLGLASDKIIILMVASFTDIKRHDLALKICRDVVKERKDIQFVFLGQGVLYNSIRSSIIKEGLADYVVMPGHVNNIGDYYSISDICMLTSIGEAFGYTILEAFNYSLPFIAYSSGGPAEIIKDGFNGYLVKPENTVDFTKKILELAGNDEKRKILGGNAYITLNKEFSRDVWINNMKDAFYNILKIEAPKKEENRCCR
ncbi:glycosyltransferase family 4 protein [Pseudobacteroides cellulosolvens]|uniref:Glycosyl transferase group 1 n=1 Tax=Pseudobacteroides cellulosolvens ATCC 35603 = DSM 2933 TaxID=398512 RepID=A0A0L6JLG2_9FIRM|nr:glycosyltransferase family 4 protein [Pseudobacteroides cellulosolvens]KNY26598.1 glycosyl transferase group 1 [Pseudobacteroides cellulosolvens ATCC 35603 = DSM 2933]